MKREAGIQTHQSNIEVSEPIPQDVEVGGNITLKVKVTCASGCDVRGGPVKVMAPDGVVVSSELGHYADKINETEEFVLPAPKQVGEYEWSVVFPRHETEHVIHEESSVPISFRTIPHKTSLALWDVPLPVAINSGFKAKVGIKCSAKCQLTGQQVEIRDETGAKTGQGRLGETPWQGTDALYWADAEITAPATEGVRFWTAKFTGAEMELAHEESSASFSFRADKPPEHRVTIKVIGPDTHAPLDHAEVRLGFYLAVTDEGGMANFEVPKGTYGLKISKDGYKEPPMTVEVSEDMTVEVEALKTLTEAEVEEKIRQFEASQWG